MADSNTLLLRVLWSYFDLLAQASQRILLIVGSFERFEIVRIEKHQNRAKPFRAYQDPTRLREYSRSWKQILAFFIRTQDDPSLRPQYKFNSIQTIAFERLISHLRGIESWDDFKIKTSLSRKSLATTQTPEIS